MKRVVKLTVDLHNKFIRHKHPRSRLFAIGRTKDFVYTEAIRLKLDGGCELVGGVSVTELSKAYIALYKKGLVFDAIVNISDSLNGDGRGSDDIFNHPDTVFLDYAYNATVARVFTKDRIRNVPVYIVQNPKQKPKKVKL